jgi:hypothetical protein
MQALLILLICLVPWRSLPDGGTYVVHRPLPKDPAEAQEASDGDQGRRPFVRAGLRGKPGPLARRDRRGFLTRLLRHEIAPPRRPSRFGESSSGGPAK